MGEDAARHNIMAARWLPRHFRVQKFCLRDTRKCDDREKEEREKRGEKERERDGLRGQLPPEKLGAGGPFLPLMCSYSRYSIQGGSLSPFVGSTCMGAKG